MNSSGEFFILLLEILKYPFVCMCVCVYVAEFCMLCQIYILLLYVDDYTMIC